MAYFTPLRAVLRACGLKGSAYLLVNAVASSQGVGVFVASRGGAAGRVKIIYGRSNTPRLLVLLSSPILTRTQTCAMGPLWMDLQLCPPDFQFDRLHRLAR